LKRAQILAFGLAAAVFLVNLALEHFLLVRTLPDGGLFPGLLDFHAAWNHGISFSLFWQSGATGARLLSLLLVFIIIGLCVWAWRAQAKMPAAGLGFIIGGALGNLYDRQIHGAVFDYLSVHLGVMPLFVCNFSDIAISAGVILLAWDAAH
jgi:signal peptidase II